MSAVILSACGSTSVKTVGDETYVRVFDQRTGKSPIALAQCLDASLKSYQASAHVRPRTSEIWVGTVPSTDSDQPQATMEIFLPTYGEAQIHAHIQAYQREPVVEEINEAIRACL